MRESLYGFCEGRTVFWGRMGGDGRGGGGHVGFGLVCVVVCAEGRGGMLVLVNDTSWITNG